MEDKTVCMPRASFGQLYLDQSFPSIVHGNGTTIFK